MAKRRANADSDDDNFSDGSPALKRARTEDGEEVSRVPLASDKGRRGKARRTDEDDDSEGGTDRAFEAEHGGRIRAALQNPRKRAGGIPAHGIVEKIEMHQFMCHKYLTFSFGPQINFIIGHNGSGKSAVLTAITVALGGKAHSTGRANGLKGFIRQGKSAAEVTISLKNQGEEAYKPDEYGDSIVITRRFTTQGNSSWRIQSKAGKLISNKKEELNAICDHMNIQVDNPMNVLTQDAARQFIGASAPKEKYKSFLRGTQLSQLADEYEMCSENVTATAKILAQKMELLPNLETAVNEAEAQLQQANEAQAQQQKIDDLEGELAWLRAAAKERKMAEKMFEAATAAQRLPKIQQCIDAEKANFTVAQAAVMKLRRELDDLGERGDLQVRKAAIVAEIKANKPELLDRNNDLKQVSSDIDAAKKLIAKCEAEIETERKRLATDTKAEREESHRQLSAAQADVVSAADALKTARDKNSTSKDELKRREDAGRELETKKTDLQRSVERCEGDIQKCLKADEDRYAAYGNRIQLVVRRIEQSQWHGEKPLGPLGAHVKLREDYHQYAEVLRSRLSTLLSSFAVTDTRDLAALRKILVEFGNPKTALHLYKPDMFDYSAGEPADTTILTVLRALEISDPHVLRIMVNKARIESLILAPTRRDAEHVLVSTKRPGTGWSGGGSQKPFQVKRYPEGGWSSTPITLKVTHPMLLVGSALDELQRWRAKKAEAERELHDATVAVGAAQREWDEARQMQDTFANEERAASRAHHEAEVRVRRLQEGIDEELPTHAQLAVIQDELKTTMTQRDVLVAQFTELSKQKAELDASQGKLVVQRNKIQADLDAFAELRAAAQARIEKADEKRAKHEQDIAYFTAKLAEDALKAKAADVIAQNAQDEFTAQRNEAQQCCEQVHTDRSTQEVEQLLRSAKTVLGGQRHGVSVKEMTRKRDKAKEDFKTATTNLGQLMALNKALKKSLDVRNTRWYDFRSLIALRCKMAFGYHLSLRGYFGKVLFDHHNQSLDLTVQTDDQAATQGGRDKLPVSLSGGERSLSTICFLISLWQSIACPLRCLDEFDVFMDSVNRRISMKMMIDTAKTDYKQYILITPQDMNNIQPGESVRVHRMTDPERGQGVLGFAS
ncbi:hypothetical protein C8R46DRAFT_268423 [Mycena filopes]|nr:hypothetical protein C8R46DRAFT_268423 [Mycena filopes]